VPRLSPHPLGVHMPKEAHPSGAASRHRRIHNRANLLA
jgi:hypothetical protein